MTQFRSALVITLLFRLQSLVIIYTINYVWERFQKTYKIVGNLIHTFDSLFQIIWKRYQLFSKLELFLYALIITQIVQNFHSQLERKKTKFIMQIHQYSNKKQERIQYFYYCSFLLLYKNWYKYTLF